MEVLYQYEAPGEDRVFVGQMKKYKVIDKNPAVERLIKHIGLFEKDNSQKTQTLADAFSQFIGQLHGSGAGKLPIVPCSSSPLLRCPLASLLRIALGTAIRVAAERAITGPQSARPCR
ncbi:MAG: hypothetical protein JF606_26370 [Burkholderiales bacterium]|jgi:hypothetical protein|nr:hypothetical protein [Burkholderiales bacterium]